MPVALVYVRVSTEDQAVRGNSLSAQIEDCTSRALALGYREQDILVFKEEGYSGDDPERPALLKMREAVRQRLGDIVIIYDPDRLARSLAQQLIITDEITSAGLKLEFVNFEWKNTAEGRLFYSLRGAIAEYEKAKIKERTVRGRVQKAKTGRLNGDPRVYGYTFNLESDTLDLNPQEAEVIKYMYHLLLHGEDGTPLSCRAIAKVLAQRGFPAPRGKAWYPATVSKILQNDTYLGTYWHYKCDYHTGTKRIRPREKQFPIPVTPIIDQATFDAAQAAIVDNARTKKGRPSSTFLLRSLVVCGECGRSLCGSTSKKKGEKSHRYYVCQGYGHGNKGFEPGDDATASRCTNRWRMERLDKVALDAIDDLFADPEAVLQKVQKLAGTQEPSFGDEMIALHTVLEQAKKEKQRLLRLFTTGRIEEEQFDSEAVLLDKRIEAASRRLAQIEQEMAAYRDGQERLKAQVDLIRTLATNYKKLNDEGKKVVVQQLIERMVVFKDGNCRITISALPLAPVESATSRESYVKRMDGASHGGPTGRTAAHFGRLPGRNGLVPQPEPRLAVPLSHPDRLPGLHPGRTGCDRRIHVAQAPV
jgi:site-specific DNA recombinase